MSEENFGVRCGLLVNGGAMSDQGEVSFKEFVVMSRIVFAVAEMLLGIFDFEEHFRPVVVIYIEVEVCSVMESGGRFKFALSVFGKSNSAAFQ